MLPEVVAAGRDEEVAGLDVLTRLGRGGDRDEATATAQEREGLVQSGAAEEVEGGVHPPAVVDLADPLRGAAVVDAVGAELAHEVAAGR